MNYEIKGTPFPVVICNLQANESMDCQKGGMAWMSPNMAMTTRGGGLGKMFSKAISGESLFTNTYTAQGGPGQIAFNVHAPGTILPFQIAPGRSIVAQKSSYLASEKGVDMSIFFQKRITSGFFGGEGFIMQKFSGNGIVFLEIDGSVVEYQLQIGQSMIVDTGYLAAMDETCQISVETVKGVGNIFLGGEGFFNTKITGPGHVWLQTMPVPTFAEAIAKYIPTKSN